VEISGTMKLILGLLCLAGMIAWQVLPYQFLKRKQREIPKKSTDELKSICQGEPNVVLLGPAIEELKSRNEDISFALPSILEMALSKNMVKNIFGRSFIKTHFAEKLPHIDLSEQTFSRPTLEKLSELREQIGKLTKT